MAVAEGRTSLVRAAAQVVWDDVPETDVNTIAQSFARKDVVRCVGETVSHQNFGQGVIVNIERDSISWPAHVTFGKNEMKLLDLIVAKLERAG